MYMSNLPSILNAKATLYRRNRNIKYICKMDFLSYKKGYTSVGSSLSEKTRKIFLDDKF